MLTGDHGGCIWQLALLARKAFKESKVQGAIKESKGQQERWGPQLISMSRMRLTRVVVGSANPPQVKRILELMQTLRQRIVQMQVPMRGRLSKARTG